MKRAFMYIIGAVLVSAAFSVNLPAKERKTKEKETPAPAAEAPKAEEGEATFTFQDEAQMQQFALLWGRRQASLTRLAVLQDYATEEQAKLGKVNEELMSQYHLDVNKHYTLNTDRKVLIEHPAPPAAGSPIASPTAPVSTP